MFKFLIALLVSATTINAVAAEGSETKTTNIHRAMIISNIINGFEIINVQKKKRRRNDPNGQVLVPS